LKIVASIRTTTDDNVEISFNGVTANYSYKKLYGSGSAAASEANAGGRTRDVFLSTGGSQTANTFANCEVYIPNYTSSNYKSYSSDTVQENNGTTAYSAMIAGLWSQTNAITSVSFASAGGYNFVQYSEFCLYGLAAVGTTPVIAPYASGGDIIQTDGTYWYHAFLSSGSFTPAKALSCDVLVVAGGGGGGGGLGGGGGAGGLLGFTSQIFTANTAQVVTIGSGGTAGSGTYPSSTSGTNGTNSSFGSLTAAIGGGGGTSSASTGGNGGSGGGGTVGYSPGTGTSGQGNAGGTGYSGGSYGGGGGGGAGAAGTNGSSSAGGAGGVGATYNTTVGGSAGPYAFIDAMGAATSTGQLVGGHYYYAGGGGGGVYSSGPAGTGGNGGGGNGTLTGTPTAGTPNTGGGGGASGNNSGTGALGGSGIVIVRYAI
jgi:hypothetical protein